jgi:hypothetical protein
VHKQVNIETKTNLRDVAARSLRKKILDKEEKKTNFAEIFLCNFLSEFSLGPFF